MLEALNDYDKNTTSDVAWVIANWMARRTVEPHNHIEDKDLILPGAQTIQRAVQAKLDSP